MGFAVITGGGTDGLYTISLDYGASVRDAMLAERNARIAELEAEIAVVVADAEVARAAVSAAFAAADIAISKYAALLNGEIDWEEIENDEEYVNIITNGLKDSMAALRKAQAAELVPRLKIQMLRERAAELRSEVSRLTSATLSETRQAWCVDLTEGGAGEVATVEVPGETDAILIAAGCRPWNQTDAVMMAREIMSPGQVFWNAAVLPGWQKFRPTYRKGTITALNEVEDTASVQLDSATSSANGLGVNQASFLSNVPVLYMTCNASAFEIGDRCIVEFQGQNWSSPRVVGFVGNPKGCDFFCIGQFGKRIYFEYKKPENYALLFNQPITISGILNSTIHRTFTAAPPYNYHALFSDNPIYGGHDASITIYNADLYFGRYIIAVGVQPKWPPELAIDKNILEIKIYNGSALVVNLAISDSGWDGYFGDNIQQTKCPGGIGPLEPADFYPVTVLDYVLTGA